MKKMTKGAIVTGLGVALLLGGGGTLATWNMDQAASAGTVQAGSMNLTTEAGKWTSNLSGDIANISEYRIVPGEKLTYTQDVTVGLSGDRIAAELSVNTAEVEGDFDYRNLTLEKFQVTKKDANGTAGDTVIDSYDGTATVDPGTYTAQATLAFNANGIQDMDSRLDLTKVAYVLEQKTPAPIN